MSEVFKYDWLVYWLDTDDKKGYYIINDRYKLQKFYDKYKNTIMIGYNINHYDKYILQGILSGFNPYDINDWIINKREPGWKYSKMLNKFPVITFDIMMPNKSLKQCEASLGMKIVESSVPFDIDRKLTKEELKDTLEYCKYDVWATFKIFLEEGFYQAPQDEFRASLGIIKEFGFPLWYLSKTKAQLGCSVLGASYSRKKEYDDEFDIISPKNLKLGKYEYIREWFLNPENHWYTKKIEGRKTPIKNELVTDVAGIKHTFAFGGVHGSVERQIIDGNLLLCDFSSLYPNIMVNFNLISRGVPNPKRYKELLDTRIRLKKEDDNREVSYKLALNSSYGQMKYKRSPIYDPKMANNVCIHGQLIAVDLIEKIENYGDIINSNTDGVLIRVYTKEDEKQVRLACKEVASRLKIQIDIDEYKRFIIKDVNNYIAVCKNNDVHAKGGYVKFKHSLEYNYNIINHAIREYFIKNISPEKTILNCNDLREFQIISNAGSKYKYALYGDKPLKERVNRVFASTDPNDKGIFKLHRLTGTKAKIEMTPERCFIINEDIRGMEIPQKLDRQWYIDLAKRRIKEFVR